MTATIRFPSRQRGSTLTGIIIGLIIGLGIAVAVALMITKGASPFTDRSNKMGRPADLDPSQANDPNKPLYGSRDAARQANKQLAEREAARAAAPAPAPAPATEADPLGEAIAGMSEAAERKPATPAAAPAPAPAPAAAAAAPNAAGAATGGDDRYVYFLQAGAFREMSDAENTRAKLLDSGIDVAIVRNQK